MQWLHLQYDVYLVLANQQENEQVHLESIEKKWIYFVKNEKKKVLLVISSHWQHHFVGKQMVLQMVLMDRHD